MGSVTIATQSMAAGRGQLDVLEWLRSRTPPCPWNEMACIVAAALQMANWMHCSGCERKHRPVHGTHAFAHKLLAISSSLMCCSGCEGENRPVNGTKGRSQKLLRVAAKLMCCSGYDPKHRPEMACAVAAGCGQVHALQ